MFFVNFKQYSLTCAKFLVRFSSSVKVYLSAKSDYCNLRKIHDLFKKKNGKWIYGDKYKIKRNRKNPATGEVLDNPGIVLRYYRLQTSGMTDLISVRN